MNMLSMARLEFWEDMENDSDCEYVFKKRTIDRKNFTI